jgi:hypothetical protein
VWSRSKTGEDHAVQTVIVAPRFNAMLKVRVPAGMPAAVARVARKRHQSASEFLRQLVIDRLLQEGVSLSDDRVETGGRRRD